MTAVLSHEHMELLQYLRRLQMKCFIISVVSEPGGNLCRWKRRERSVGNALQRYWSQWHVYQLWLPRKRSHGLSPSPRFWEKTREKDKEWGRLRHSENSVCSYRIIEPFFHHWWVNDDKMFNYLRSCHSNMYDFSFLPW